MAYAIDLSALEDVLMETVDFTSVSFGPDEDEIDDVDQSDNTESDPDYGYGDDLSDQDWAEQIGDHE